MIPAEIIERIIKKVQEMQEAEASESESVRHRERIRMFLGVECSKWLNKYEGEDGEFYVLKKTTVSYGYQYGKEVVGECLFDVYDDEQVYVNCRKYTIYNEYPHQDLSTKCHRESISIIEEEDIIVSCERLWMH